MIIVTGGAGFIGSNLVAALEARGIHDLVVCDRLGVGEKWQNLARRELAALVPPEDLFDFLNAHADAVDAIFHLGAVSATTERDGDLIAATNIALPLRLWAWCAVHSVRLIYASSAATYGDGSEGFDDDGSVEALARLRPLNAYGWSKHVFDRRVARMIRDGRPKPPQWAGLKFFNVYGPNEYHKDDMRSVVAKLYPQLAAGEAARLFRSYRSDYPDGGQKRDFIWVGDCVSIMLWLMDNPAVEGLFNVGTGRARSWESLAKAVFAAMDRPPAIRFIDMPENLRDRYQYFTEARMDRLRRAGYDRPLVDLEDGIDRYVRGHLATPDPYL